MNFQRINYQILDTVQQILFRFSCWSTGIQEVLGGEVIFIVAIPAMNV